MRKKPKKGPPSTSTRFLLKLFITGTTPHSRRAIINTKRICEKYLKDNYDLEVIDIYQKPDVAKKEQLIAAPTLIKVLPKPMRRLIGDMSNEKRALLGMGIEFKNEK
jgi:circadian clock protein KaiB